jgi:hypothetical protein
MWSFLAGLVVGFLGFLLCDLLRDEEERGQDWVAPLVAPALTSRHESSPSPPPAAGGVSETTTKAAAPDVEPASAAEPGTAQPNGSLSIRRPAPRSSYSTPDTLA